MRGLPEQQSRLCLLLELWLTRVISWQKMVTKRELCVDFAPFDVAWVEQTASTNADLLAAARQGAPANSVLVADVQTHGKGRRGRAWLAPPRSALLFSVLLRPNLEVSHASLVTTALAVGVAEACEQIAGVRPLLKWPNDLLVGDRKLAGVLAESLSISHRLQAVVVGMGLNVHQVPVEVAPNAVCLEDVCGGFVNRLDRATLLAAILERLSFWMTGIEVQDKQAELLAQARKHSATLGQRVCVYLGDGTILEGIAQDLDQTGALLLAEDMASDVVAASASRCIRVVSADVVHLRRA